jgi:hypothetical protein
MRSTSILAALASAAVCALSSASSAQPQAAATPQLVSHKAIYDLSLIEGVGTKTPASASGKIAFEFSSACEGYVQTLRQVVDMQPQEGERRLSETRSTTFEDVKGVDFRFNTAASQVGKGEQVDGRAARDARGMVAVALSRPKPYKFSFSVEDGVSFPTQHIANVIAAAQRGEKVYLARVYDASDDGRKIYDVTAIIGKAEEGPDPDRGARAAGLRGLRRWPVALAYFPTDVRDGLPDYVLSFNLYENGVSTRLKLDYGDFALTGELTNIEFPPAAKCQR